LSLFSASSLSAIPELGFVLGIMVLVHEFGHFAAAKLCKVRVEAFAIGFGRKLFGFESGGTSYQVNILPLGGYVKMAGELPGESHNSDDPGEFQNHPRWQRTIITLAGPIANFILSLLLMTGLFMTHHEMENYITQPVTADYVSPSSDMGKTGIQPGDQIVHIDSVENPNWADVETRAALDLNRKTPFSYLHNQKRVDTMLSVAYAGRQQDFDPIADLGIIPVMQPTPVAVTSLEANMPAAAAGLQPKDLIVAMNGLHLHSLQAMLAYLKDNGAKPVLLTVDRPLTAGAVQTLAIPVTPVWADAQEGKAWRIGFAGTLPPTHVDRLSFPDAVSASYDYNLKNSKLIFVVLQRLLTRQVSVKSLSSPIGIGVQVHQAFEVSDWLNPLPVIQLMAMISLNLGIFNLLPIPILDGGMIVFLAIESAIRRDLPPRFKERIYQVAFVCIILFAAVVIFNDITKFLPVHPKP
jgi:regulator of sigma E protease